MQQYATPRDFSLFQDPFEDWLLRAVLAGLGFAPIGCLCLSLFNIAPLHVTVQVVLLPSIAALIVLCLKYPQYKQKVCIGLAAGFLACIYYDVNRLLLVEAGLWRDFVPRIGCMMFNADSAHPLWGYAWRLIGNGGGMGIAFAMLPWRLDSRVGIIFGVGIWACLLVTLLFSERAQAVLFPLNAPTFAASLLGHLEYGAMLGLLVGRYFRKRNELRFDPRLFAR